MFIFHNALNINVNKDKIEQIIIKIKDLNSSSDNINSI